MKDIILKQVSKAIDEIIKVEGDIGSTLVAGGVVIIRFENGTIYKQALISKSTTKAVLD